MIKKIFCVVLFPIALHAANEDWIAFELIPETIEKNRIEVKELCNIPVTSRFTVHNLIQEFLKKEGVSEYSYLSVKLYSNWILQNCVRFEYEKKN